MNDQSTNDESGRSGGLDYPHPMKLLHCGRSDWQVARRDRRVACSTSLEWGTVGCAGLYQIGLAEVAGKSASRRSARGCLDEP